MTKNFAAKALRVSAVVLLASCFGESTGPDLRYARLNIAPAFDVHGLHAVDVNRVHLVVTRLGGSPVLIDTTVAFPATDDTLQLDLPVAIQGSQEDLELSMFLLDDPGGVVVFQSGPDVITVQAGSSGSSNTVVPVPLYVGVGSHAAGVRFLTSPTSVYFSDSVTFTAEAFDSSNATLPNTPIVWTISDTTKAIIRNDTMGRVVAKLSRGNVAVVASLLRTSNSVIPPNAQRPLIVQPVASALVLVSGGGQTGGASQPLAQPVLVRVNAADALGVAGVIVTFAVTSGGGSLSQLVDTTDATGNASVNWTLGPSGGAQGISASAAGVAGSLPIAATATAGTATQLAFTTAPTTVVSGVAITPSIVVTARDAGGVTATSFTGNVTLALGNNPTGATLSGTLVRAAVAGVATFPGISIDNIGTGYTLTATSGILTAATSGAVGVTAPANVNAWINAAGGNWSTAANWSLGTVPSAADTVWIKQPGTYTVNLDVNATVARLDVGGSSGTQTLQLNANTLTMAGNGAFTTAGRLTLGGGTLRGAGTLDLAGVTDWTGGTLGGDGGTTRVLAGGTLNIVGATARTHVNHTLELNGNGTWSGNAQVNSGLTSILRVGAGATLTVTGDPQMNLNQGGTAALDNLGTVIRSTSANSFVVNVALSGAGTYNVLTGILDIQRGGTPNGTFNVSAGANIQVNGGTFTFGAGSNVTGAGSMSFLGGTVTLTGAYGLPGTSVNGGTVNFSGAGTMTTGTLNLQSGTLGGSGLFTVSGAMNWSGGNLVGGGGTTRVLSSGSLAISGTGARAFTGYTLEQASATGTWTSTGQVNSGLTSTLRILSGGSIDVQGTPQYLLNQGGASLFDNQGTLLKSGAGTLQISSTFTSTGTITGTNGTVQLTGGGTLANAIGVTSPALINVSSGTVVLANGLNVTGTGTFQLTGGTLSVPGATDTVRFVNLELNGGALTQNGVVRPASLQWTGGASINGTGKVLIAASGVMTMPGVASRTFTGGTIENNGLMSWGGTFQVNSGLGSVVRNMPGATFEVIGDGLLSLNQGGASTFDNQGTFNRIISPNSINWTVAFNQSAAATSNINTGTLVLSGGGTHSGTFAVANGAFLDYSAGVYTFSSHQANGAGTVHWQGGTLTTASATDSAKFVNLQLNGGTIAETGVVRVSGLLDWAGNTTINGAGKVLSTISMTITGTAGRTFTTGTVENTGIATWTGALQINTGLGAVMRNLGPGASFTLSADGNFAQNQGFPQTVFDNQGTFNRNLTSGTATWGVFYQDTTAISTTTVSTGVFALSGGGRFGGGAKSIAAGATLDLTGGTVTARPATTFSGAGLFRASGGSLFAPDSASAVAPVTNAVNAVNFDLTGTASLAHEGLFIVGTIMNWTGGTIASNSAAGGQQGGITRINGTLNISNAGAITLSGAHTLDNQGTINYSGAGNINVGVGPVINNGGAWNWSGNGSILNNQGAPTIQFNNVGGLTRNTSASAVTLDAVMNKTGGFTLTTGTLILPRGSVTAFQGNVNGTGTLDLSGGTFTQTGTIAYLGNLILSGGTLALNGFGAGVTGNFTTSGGGNLVMTVAADSLDVNGNIAFGGGTGTLSNGVIRAAGNFTQTGVTTYAPGPNTAPQRVVLDGGGAQTLTFATTVNSFFRRLEINKAAGNVVLASNVKASWVRLLGAGAYTISGATARFLTDTIIGTNGSQTMSPLVVEISSVMGDSGNFSPDTTVFTGTNQTIPNNVTVQFAYKSIRIAQTTGTATWNLTTGRVLPNDLIVSSGALNLNGRAIGLNGDFRTEGSGTLSMTNAADSIGADGDVSFGGGPSTISAGVISVKGNFSQSGASASYAPTGLHRTRFDLPGSAVVQQISFANPTLSFFDSVMANRGSGARGTINFQTDARITRGISINNSTDVTGPTARLTVAGGTVTIPQVTTSGTLNSVLAVELNQAPVIGPGAPLFSPDTTVFNGTIANLPVQVNIAYKSIRVNTTGTFALASDTISGDLDIATGNASLSTGFMRLGGKLRTRGSATLSMPIGAGAPNIEVQDSAIFAGGSSAPQTGTLRFLGHFNAVGAAYRPLAAHNSVFAGNIAGGAGQRVLFTSPGIAAGNSWFGNLFIGRAVAGSSAPTGIQLTTDAFAIGTLQDSSTNAAANDSIMGNFVLTASLGLSTGSQMVFNAARLVLNGYTTFNTSGLTFRNMNPASTYLTLIRGAAGADGPSGINFATPVTAGTGKYFNLNATATYSLSVTGANPIFTAMTGNYVKTGSPTPTVQWNGQNLP